MNIGKDIYSLLLVNIIHDINNVIITFDCFSQVSSGDLYRKAMWCHEVLLALGKGNMWSETPASDKSREQVSITIYNCTSVACFSVSSLHMELCLPSGLRWHFY